MPEDLLKFDTSDPTGYEKYTISPYYQKGAAANGEDREKMLQEIAKDRKETKQKLDDANRKYSQIVAAENSNKPEYSEPVQPRENTRVVMPEPAINSYAVEKQTAKKKNILKLNKECDI